MPEDEHKACDWNVFLILTGQPEGYLEVFHITSAERHISIFQGSPLSGRSPHAVFHGDSDWSTLAHEVGSHVHKVRTSSKVASQEIH